MTFEVEINGRARVVSIEASGAPTRFRISIQDRHRDGVPVTAESENYEIEARQTDRGVAFVYVSDHRSVDAALAERPGGQSFVQLRHADVVVAVDGRRSRRSPSTDGAGKGEQRITAPMPGRVVRVLVRPGDEVSARQGLLVIEAMKMENELAAARAGRVTEVAVTEGMSVEAGRLLVRVE